MSQESYQNEIIEGITSWDVKRFVNPSGWPSMVQGLKRIVPISEMDLFHVVNTQYVKVKKEAQEPIQMKIN